MKKVTKSEKQEQKMKKVTLIASGYDWECPDCNKLNSCKYSEYVTCKHCGITSEVGDELYHATG